MTHFHWRRLHLADLHLPHLHLPHIVRWRGRTRRTPAHSPAASKSTPGALAALLMVGGAVLGASILIARLQVDVVAAAEAPPSESVPYGSAAIEDEPDRFELAKRMATEQELPPQF